MIWYKKFFSIKHEIEHLFISWVFCFVISIHIRPPKIEWIHHFIKLFPIFKDNIMVSCFENLLKNASKIATIVAHATIMGIARVVYSTCSRCPSGENCVIARS